MNHGVCPHEERRRDYSKEVGLSKPKLSVPDKRKRSGKEIVQSISKDIAVPPSMDWSNFLNGLMHG